MTIKSLVIIALGIGFLLPHGASAKAKLSVGVAPATLKMTKYKNTKDLYPLSGPVIRVYSSDGERYDRIANDNENLSYLVDVWASCNRKIRSLTLNVNGAEKNVKHTSSKGKKVKRRTEKIKAPFTLPNISRSPAKACRAELDKRVALGKKSRAAWMTSGFVVKYDNAYQAKVTGSCSATLGKGDFEAESTSLPVWIVCEAVKGGSTPKPHTPKPNTGSSSEGPKIPAKPAAPAKVVLSLNASPKVLEKCPASIKFTGKMISNRKGTIKYRIVGSEAGKAWQTPVKSIVFKQKGTKTLSSWTHSFHQPDTTGNLALKAPGGLHAIKGSAKIVLLEKPKGAKVVGGTATYQIWCDGKPKRQPVKPRAARKE